MKVYITEFTYKDKHYEGPTVVAHSFDEAEAKAEVYGCTVVGILDMIITEDEAAEWNRVLH
tara:strand:+ start:426 stop:608 length:183 start_codon:yes stop_codon:yes gene_type:complete